MWLKGPIGLENRENYCLVSTFHLGKETNKNRTSCKICGIVIEQKEGFGVWMQGYGPGIVNSAFLCKNCEDRIQDAKRALKIIKKERDGAKGSDVREGID